MDDPILLDGEASAPRTPLARFEADLVRHLRAEAMLSDAALEEALSGGDGRLSTRLWSLGLLSEAELRDAFSQCLRVPVANPDTVVAGAPDFLDILSRAEVAEFRLLAYAARGDRLLVATCEPWRLALFEDLGERINRRIQPSFLDEAPLARLLERFHEIPADPRFHARPELRTRPSLLSERLVDAAESDKDEAEQELMSSTHFDRLYQR